MKLQTLTQIQKSFTNAWEGKSIYACDVEENTRLDEIEPDTSKQKLRRSHALDDHGPGQALQPCLTDASMPTIVPGKEYTAIISTIELLQDPKYSKSQKINKLLKIVPHLMGA